VLPVLERRHGHCYFFCGVLVGVWSLWLSIGISRDIEESEETSKHNRWNCHYTAWWLGLLGIITSTQWADNSSRFLINRSIKLPYNEIWITSVRISITTTASTLYPDIPFIHQPSPSTHVFEENHQFLITTNGSEELMPRFLIYFNCHKNRIIFSLLSAQ